VPLLGCLKTPVPRSLGSEILRDSPDSTFPTARSIVAWHGDTVHLDTRFLDGLRVPNLDVRRHDIGAEPLPEATFDLVHVPRREAALARMAAALKPGGWLVVEEAGPPAWEPSLQLEPVAPRPRAFELLLQVMEARGVALGYGRSLRARMRALCQREIGAEGRVVRGTDGSPGAWVVRAGIEQLREGILATGRISEPEYEADLARLDDPAFAFTSPLMWAAWGHRPAA
jgi:SAM-dependent methyltransferase